MKRISFLIATILCLGISACVDGQFNKTVYGNKQVVKKDRTIGPITGIKVSSGIDVYLRQGDDLSLSVEADENLHEYIITEVRNGILHVYSDVNIREAKMKKVYLSMKDITSISTTSAGDVFGETPIKCGDKEIELSASSAGDIKLEVYANKVRADISSSGDITLSGESDRLSADLSSAGDLNAFNLKVREANVSVSSAGDADLYVTESLNAHASSAGDINYKGDPKFVDAHSSSAGGVHRK